MKRYESIDSVFERDPKTHTLILGKVRNMVHSTIRGWAVTEKIDGMNIRLIITFDGVNLPTAEVRGRSDTAVLPPKGAETVLKSFDAGLWFEKVFKPSLLGSGPKVVTLYGELFGEGIQKNPLRLSGLRFRVFDILVGDKFWFGDDEIRSYAAELNFQAVPFLGLVQGLPRNQTELDAITQQKSRVATEPLLPEGIVARPLIPLFDRYGNRIIWKLAYREFDKLAALELNQTPTEQADESDAAAIQQLENEQIDTEIAEALPETKA